LDRQPRGFPAILIGSVLAVLLAGSAGFLLWWLTRTAAEVDTVRALPPPGSDVDRVELGPVDHAPGTVVEERQRVDHLVDAVVFGKGGKPEGRDAARQALVAQGRIAIPRLLDALHRLHAEDGFAGPETRVGAALADRVLREIRKAQPPSPQPAGAPLTGREEPAVVERRAKAWFLWWRSTPPPPSR